MTDQEFVGSHRNLVKLCEVLCLMPLDDMLAEILQAKRLAPTDQPALNKLAESSLVKMEDIVRKALGLANARIAARGSNEELNRRNELAARGFLENL